MASFIYKHPLPLAILWALIIFGLCATPGQYIPSADWLELLSFDKFVHGGMFFILTTLLLLVAFQYKQTKTALFIYFISAVSYGALLELMQATCFSNRSADWKDIVANTFGCVIAFVFTNKIKKGFDTVLQNAN